MDAFLKEPALLRGQPKKTIGDYVESHGILVPRRYSGLDEARASGKPFIIRSEYVGEYDGPSGLFSSQSITAENVARVRESLVKRDYNPDKVDLFSISERLDDGTVDDIVICLAGTATQTELERQMVYANTEKSPQSQGLAGVYATFLKINPAELGKSLSFSYWEALAGQNRLVIADSAVKSRYHIVSHWSDEARNDYVITEGKEVILSRRGSEQAQDTDSVIQFYEQIRTLPLFDKNHCPIIEFQTVGGKHHFLQYHRTRDFNEAKFCIDQDITDAIQADFVRGCTTEEGLDLISAIYYPRGQVYDGPFPDEEDASYDFHPSIMFTEIMSRRRKATFISKSLLRISFDFACHYHAPKTALFKPGISILLPIEQLIKEQELELLLEQSRTCKAAQIPLHVVSDGRTCYVKRLDK